MKHSRIILVAALLLALPFGAAAQNALYKKYSSTEGISKVYISSAMFRLMGKNGGDNISVGNKGEIDLSALAGKLTGMYILSTENPEIGKNLIRDFKAMTDKSNLELLMEADDEGDHVVIYSCREGNIITDFYLCSEESDGECTVLQIKGALTDEDVAAIVENAQ